MTASVQLRAVGVDCRLVVTQPDMMPSAQTLLRRRLAELDAVASRFRRDSEVSILAATPPPPRGGPVTAAASLLLRSLIDDALWAATTTAGLVDPTLGRAMEHNGYDADLAEVRNRSSPDQASRRDNPRMRSTCVAQPPSTVSQLRVNHIDGTVTAAAGTLIDLGATGKASMADRIAHELADSLIGGFLVDLGGDIAVAGPWPVGGWVVAVDDPGAALPPRLSLTTQGVATSGTNRRYWRVGDVVRHHLLDPVTGRPVARTWRQVTCVGASALEANTGATAACVLGGAAAVWLTERRIPARLVPERGVTVCTPGWPLPVALGGWTS